MERVKQRSCQALAAFLMAVAMAFALGLGATTAWAEDTVVTVGTDTTSPNNQAPLQNAWKYGITQQIYTADEIGTSGSIKSLGFNVQLAATKYKMTNLKIALGYKSSAEFSGTTDWLPASDLTEVYNGTPDESLFWSTGWNTIQFDTPFEYDASQGNLVVAVTVATSQYDGQLRFHTTSTANSVVTLGSDNQPDGSDKSPFRRNTRPNIQLTFGAGGGQEQPAEKPAIIVSIDSASEQPAAGGSYRWAFFGEDDDAEFSDFAAADFKAQVKVGDGEWVDSDAAVTLSESDEYTGVVAIAVPDNTEAVAKQWRLSYAGDIIDWGYTSADCPAITQAAYEAPAAIKLTADNVALDKETYYFTGAAVEPVVTVKVGEETLVKDTHYTVAYADNAAAGTGKVTVTAIEGSGYAGTVEKPFTIEDVTGPWAAADFTYGDVALTQSDYVNPGNANALALLETIHVVTGFSESGQAKLAGGKTDLVIPAADVEGAKVQGVAKDAFKSKGLTSVQFPTVAKVPVGDDDPWKGYRYDGVTERGDFFILYGAFSRNNLTSLELPEGVLFLGTQAFSYNTQLKSVTFPQSLMVVSSQAFASDALESLTFPDHTDYQLSLLAMSFAINKITEVTLPGNIYEVGVPNSSKVSAFNAFFRNTGKEAFPADAPTTVTKWEDTGVVYLYVDNQEAADRLASVDKEDTYYHKVIVKVPALEWSADCFTYSEDNATVTGLTDLGKQVLKADPAMVIPDKNGDVDITAIGAATGAPGTFGFVEDGVTYAPTSVVLPAGLKEIGNFAFAATYDASVTPWAPTGLASVEFPATLEKIGQTAFQNAPLDKIVLPDSVTELGLGAFTTNEKVDCPKLSELVISKNLKALPQNAFGSRKVDAIVIPEGVETVGRGVFAGSKCTSLSIPGTVTLIDREGFKNHALTNVEIPGSVKTIGQSAFYSTPDYAGAPTMETLVLNEGLKEIGNTAFRGQKLTEVAIPATLKTLHKDAFKENANAGRPDGKVVLTTAIADQVNAAGEYTGVVADGSGHIVEYAAPAKPEFVIISRDSESYDTDDIEYQPAIGGKYLWIAQDGSFANDLYGAVEADDFKLQTKKQADTDWVDAVEGTIAIESVDDWDVRIVATIPDNTESYDKMWRAVYKHSDVDSQYESCASVQFVQMAAEAAEPAITAIAFDKTEFVSADDVITATLTGSGLDALVQSDFKLEMDDGFGDWMTFNYGSITVTPAADGASATVAISSLNPNTATKFRFTAKKYVDASVANNPQVLTYRQPPAKVFTKAEFDKTEFDAAGGTLTVAITGENLDQAKAADFGLWIPDPEYGEYGVVSDSGIVATCTPAADGLSATVTFALPANGTDTDVAYTFNIVKKPAMYYGGTPTFYSAEEVVGAKTVITVKAPVAAKAAIENVEIDAATGSGANQPAVGGVYAWFVIGGLDADFEEDGVTGADFSMQVKVGDGDWTDSADATVEFEVGNNSDEGVVTATVPDNTEAVEKQWRFVYNAGECVEVPAITQAAAKPAISKIEVNAESGAEQPAVGGVCAWVITPASGSAADFKDLTNDDFQMQVKSGEADWADCGHCTLTFSADEQAGYVSAQIPDNTGDTERQWRFVYAGQSVECPVITQAAAAPAVDKTALEAAIAAAKAAEEGVKVSADGFDVDPADKYTTEAEKKALDDAIAAAEAVAAKTDATQAEVDTAKSDVEAAQATYEAAKKAGTKKDEPVVTPADTKALNEAIDAAVAAAAADDAKYASDADKKALDDAIAAAKAVAAKTDATQAEVDEAVKALNGAKDTFGKAAATAKDKAEKEAAEKARANQKGKDGTAVGEGASAEAAEKAIMSAKSDEGPAGSKFGKVQLRSTKQAKKAVTLKWTKVKGAKKYVVYAGKCGQKGMKKVKALAKTTLTFKKAMGKALKAGKYYKAIVVALDKDSNVISTSKAIHVKTKGGKTVNPGKVTTKAKKSKVTVKKGKSFALKGKAAPATKGKKISSHRAVKYETSNAKIATVSKKGVIKGKKAGTCTVYAYAQNGVFAKIKVTVKAGSLSTAAMTLTASA